MTNQAAQTMPEQWPEYVMLRDTKLHDDAGGLGQRIYTTAGAGYKKVKYVREDIAALSQTAGVVLARGWFHALPDEDDYEFHDDANGAGKNCDGCIRAMIVAAPAASGGEDDRSGWCRSDGCVHKKFGEPTWKEGDNPFQSVPTAPSAASVSERAREILASQYESDGFHRAAKWMRDSRSLTHAEAAALRAIEQALTQQRGEPVAWQMRCRYWDGAPWSEWQTFPSNEARELDWAPYKDSQWLRETRELYTTPQPSADAVAALESRAARLEEALRRIVDSIDESGDPQWKGSPVEQQARAALLGGSG